MSDKSLKDRIAIVGIGETEFVRASEKNLEELVMEAVLKAIEDAGLSVQEVDGLVTDATIMWPRIKAEDVGRNLGIAHRTFSACMSLGGAGVVGAPLLAAAAIDQGLARNIVCYFGVDWGSAGKKYRGPYQFHADDPFKANFEVPFGWFPQPVYFATFARRHMHEYGTTSRQLGAIAVACRKHACLNPTAQMRTPITLEEYERSPLVAEPLHVLDCCLITDGAGAYVMTSAERARDLRHAPIYVMGAGFGAVPQQNQHLLQTQDISGGARYSAVRAFEMAGISHQEIDFAEIYDCFTISCLSQIEEMGFCQRGEGGPFVEGGRIELGGELPVNTHGGLLSHAYVLGIAHVTEAVRQLRREAGPRQVENAEIGLVAGYSGNEHSVMILRR